MFIVIQVFLLLTTAHFIYFSISIFPFDWEKYSAYFFVIVLWYLQAISEWKL